MTFVLYRKLLRDVRVPLVAVWLLLAGFGGLWVKVTVQVTTEISPMLNLIATLAGFGVGYLHELFFEGPGKLLQTFLGGPAIKFIDPDDTLAVVATHPLVQAVICIWAIGRGAGAVAGEIDRGTMELLLAQPVARRKIVLAHLLVDLTTIPILCIALFVGLRVGVWLVGDFTVDPGVYEAAHQKVPKELPTFTVHPNRILPGLTNTAMLFFAVSGYTMWLSAAGRSRTKVQGYAIMLTLTMFLVNVIGQLWDGLTFLRPFTVFYYYQPQAINMQGQWSVDPGVAITGRAWGGVPVLLVLGLVGGLGYAMALRTFVRRDVPAPL
jgi:ABC-2 type transport system permease protein